MKQLLNCLLFLFFAYSGIAQEVLPKQQTLVTKMAATWCVNCGTWGWDTYEGMIDENPEEAIFITAHYNGDLHTKTAEAFSKNFKSIGQPQFFLNNSNTGLHEGNRSLKRTEIIEAVKENATKTPIANTGITYSLNDKTLTAQLKTKFFQNTSGVYSVAVYVLEDGVSNFQAGKEEVVEHKKVLRGSLTEEDFGRTIGSLQIASGTEYNRTFSTVIPDEWNTDRLSLVAVIWKKEGDEFHFVNGSTIQVAETLENSPNVGNTLDFDKFPWLQDIIDEENCCDNNSVAVYNSSIYQYVYVDGMTDCSSNDGTLYFQDGTFYCMDSPSMDCRTAYGLLESDIAQTWQCDETISPVDTIIEMASMEEFDKFPWLQDLVSNENCCDTKTVTAYYTSIYTYLYIEAADNCGTVNSKLYFQDGTFYCEDAGTLDCRTAYGLEEERSTILWRCGEGIASDETIVVDSTTSSVPVEIIDSIVPISIPINYLALGDSYTIGTSVSSTQNYPNQLQTRLSADGVEINPAKIIARVGWSTGNLQSAINQAQLTPDYDLVSLLIGVNNQFRGRSTVEYRREFESLLQQAIELAKGKKENVFVLSIPDYAFTPFGQRSNATLISQEIDEFNAINKSITEQYEVLYFDITPISRKGNEDTILVAPDGLHPSGEQYRRWVETIYSEVKKIATTL